jgi:hypothetical protein
LFEQPYSMPPALRVSAILLSLVLELLCLYRLWRCFCVPANADRTKLAGGPDDGMRRIDEMPEEEHDEYGEDEYEEEYGEEYAQEPQEEYLHEYEDDRRPKQRSGSKRTYNDKDPGETVLD